MQYELSPQGKARIERIAERNNLPKPVALEVLLLLADLGEWQLEAVSESPDLTIKRQHTLLSLPLTARLRNALVALDYSSDFGSKKGIHATVSTLASIPLLELLRARNMGRKSLKEWSECLVSYGYPPLPV